MTDTRSSDEIRADLRLIREPIEMGQDRWRVEAEYRLIADVSSLLAERDSLRGVVQAVEALHRPVADPAMYHTICTHDGHRWPCPTVAALAAAADAPQPEPAQPADPPT